MCLFTLVRGIFWGFLSGRNFQVHLGFSRPSHINVLEMMAAFESLRHFRQLLVGRTVLLLTGQHNCGCLRSIVRAAPGRPACSAVAVVSGGGDHSSSVFYPGRDNLVADFLSRGRCLPSEWALSFGGLRSSPVGLVSFGDRTIRIPLQPPASEVLFSGPGSGGLGVGCFLDPWGSSSELCVSPVRLDSSGLEENQVGRGVGSVDRPSLAEEVLVSGPPGIVGGGNRFVFR